MKPTLASLDAESRLLGDLLVSLVDDGVLHAASDSTRRPKFRMPGPVHKPLQDAERRRALATGAAVRCPVCSCLVPVVEPGKECFECLTRW